MSKTRISTRASIFGLMVGSLLAPVAAPVAAWAQAAPPASDEIVVTAQRRSEKQVDVPISVATLSAKSIEDAGVQQLGDISKLTPSLRFDSAGTFFQPTIRGVGTAITTSGGGPNVGIYSDGFFQSNPESANFNLMRIKSIQVLKGPQGTLFGRNTTGGAIIVTTDDPSTKPAFEARASYGRFNALKLQAYGTFGLAENVAMDIEGQYARGDGFVTNVVNNDNKVGKYRNWSVRTGLKAELSSNVSVLLRYTHSDTSDPTALLNAAYVDTTGQAAYFKQVSAAGMGIYGLFGYTGSKGVPLVNLAILPPLYPALSIAGLKAAGAIPATWNGTEPTYATGYDQIASTNRIAFTNKSDSVQGTVKADLGFAQLTSYTQYRKDEGLNLQDLDNSAANFFYAHLGIPNETISQEFLLNSKPGGKLQWTAGLNYFQNRDTYVFGFAGPPFFQYGGSSTLTKSYAAFLDATYEVKPDLFITLGGRYSHDVVTDAYFNTTPGQSTLLDVNGAPGCAIGGVYPACTVDPAGGTKIKVPDLKNNRFTPRVVVRFKPDAYSSIYASWTRGYKAGILNVGGASKQPIRPESIDAFEAGYKYDHAGFSFDAAAYYYNYKDLQVSSFQSGQAQIRNAAKSEIYGIEANGRFRVSDALVVNGGIAWTHARYKSFPNAPYYGYCDPSLAATASGGCAFGAGGLTQYTVNASGYNMQRAPDFTASVGANYTVPVASGALTLSSNLYYTSKFYLDPTQQFLQEGYATLSLRAQWEDPSKHFTIAAYGDNVTNHRYRTVISYNTIGTGVAWSAPASWGVQIGYKY